ncbi:uncharacterized protein Dana_GF21066 [Drosophila ananassae]|uniref:Uncharacterized protein n=1 Tax=Drosophila ananassae TaxID=7217 RepID=B3MR46_DROAN|nr:uncharacterized protein LOC6503755 [Drosophila ananassae]EDV34251.1 uncharacterized protein Dana_GF21066 [Drosophila ananassae]
MLPFVPFNLEQDPLEAMLEELIAQFRALNLAGLAPDGQDAHGNVIYRNGYVLHRNRNDPPNGNGNVLDGNGNGNGSVNGGGHADGPDMYGPPRNPFYDAALEDPAFDGYLIENIFNVDINVFFAGAGEPDGSNQASNLSTGSDAGSRVLNAPGSNDQISRFRIVHDFEDPPPRRRRGRTPIVPRMATAEHTRGSPPETDQNQESRYEEFHRSYMEIQRLQRLFMNRHARISTRSRREPAPNFDLTALSTTSSSDEILPTPAGTTSPAAPADRAAEAAIPPAAVPGAAHSAAAAPEASFSGAPTAGNFVDGAAVPEVVGDPAAQAQAPAQNNRRRRHRRPRRPLVQEQDEPFHDASRNLYENNDPNSSAFYGYMYRRRFH